MKYKKPQRIKRGDLVAVISPSWSGPNNFPLVYENGLNVLKEWGLKIKEYPTTRANDKFILENPDARAKDINDAFADRNIKAIFSSIGGDDSIRILPFLNKKNIIKNPKIIMGFSDTTTLLTFLNMQGLVTFYGPSIMAGFSQLENLPKEFKSHIYQILFEPKDFLEYKSYNQYCDGYPDWSKQENIGKTKVLKPNTGWNVIQGSGIIEGELFGGCIDVFEFMKGTKFWPTDNFWVKKILFLEISEEKPTIVQLKRILRNYGMQGVFDKVNAILFGRLRDYSSDEKINFEKMIKDVIKDEFDKPNLPIMTNVDFGHTDPQIILPLGIKAQIDFDNKKFRLIDSWLK